MSAGSMLSVFLTLAVVLGVMGVALKLLRKYTVGGATRDGAIKMEVLQRVTLGQRQGIAVVRIGTRVLAVSMGDGGVHPVAELSAGELTVDETTSIGEVAGLSIAKVADSIRSIAPIKKPVEETVLETQRISYIAPMEDFQAVLNIAMSGTARS